MCVRLGRRDNQWVSPVGCLMFSVYSRLSIAAASSPFLNYVVCIAIVRAIKSLAIAKLKVKQIMKRCRQMGF